MENERERLILWLPVFFGGGIGVYFALPEEPTLLIMVLSFLLGLAFLALIWVLKASLPVKIVTAAIASFLSGLLFAKLHIAFLEPNTLRSSYMMVSIQGRIAEMENRSEGSRILLDQVKIQDLPPARTPKQVRITLRDDRNNLSFGDWVSLRANLYPPRRPALPGGYDFQKASYFQEIGGIGYAIGSVQKLASPEEKGGIALRFQKTIADMRQVLAAEITSHLPGAAGEVAAVLITGQQQILSPAVLSEMRDSGLAHILSVSGLHIGLVAGFLLFSLRALLALIPPVALRFPIKKWAASIALLGTGFYMLLAGASVPTQRAFLMAGLALLAVLLDRNPLSMRMLAWAALLVLMINPEALTGPSFQMSFAAVVALIAGHEWSLQFRARDSKPRSSFLIRYIGGLAVTSGIAGFATAPYAAYHFHRLAHYGLLANMLAVPLAGLWIMPLVVIALVLAPFGLMFWALTPMGWGIDAMLSIAKWVAGLPHSTSTLPPLPLWVLCLFTLSGLWLCLWRSVLRYLALPVLLITVILPWFGRTPDLLISETGQLVAIKIPATAKEREHFLYLSTNKAGFEAESWQQALGAGRFVTLSKSAKETEEKLSLALQCDARGCLYRRNEHSIAIAWDVAAIAEDCEQVELMISLIPVSSLCRRLTARKQLIDPSALLRHGAHAIWIENDSLAIQTVEGLRGKRAWTSSERSKPSR